MFSFLTNGLPKCTKCVHYVPYGISKSFDLAKCNRFLDKDNKAIYAEMARLDNFKCSIYGFEYKPKNMNEIHIDSQLNRFSNGV
jgi:hypothetical protein